MVVIKMFMEMCTKLGNTFGFGFWEGLIIYGAIFLIALLKIIDIIDMKKNSKK